MAVEDLGQTSWASSSFRDPSDPFRSDENRDNDEENLIWAALEKLPTYDRIRKSVLRQVVDGEVVASEIDVRHLGMQNRKILKEMMLKAVEEDNERFLLRLRERIDRVGIELPKIEVRFEDLSVEADTYYGGRALPTLFNATMNAVEGLLGLVWLSPSKKKNLKILNGICFPTALVTFERFTNPHRWMGRSRKPTHVGTDLTQSCWRSKVVGCGAALHPTVEDFVVMDTDQHVRLSVHRRSKGHCREAAQAGWAQRRRRSSSPQGLRGSSSPLSSLRGHRPIHMIFEICYQFLSGFWSKSRPHLLN